MFVSGFGLVSDYADAHAAESQRSKAARKQRKTGKRIRPWHDQRSVVAQEAEAAGGSIYDGRRHEQRALGSTRTCTCRVKKQNQPQINTDLHR